MNIKIKIVLSIWLFLLSPIFVSAKTCYVDDDGHNGDGSKGSPYKTIAKALDKKCDKIKLAKGEYNEKVVISSGVDIEGEGNKSIITQSVKMKNNSSLSELYVKGGGIEVLKDAKATIKNVKVTGAHIGIKTTGGGDLIVKNCKITKNKKGFYLQYGKNVDIRNNEVIDNKEEGIDIRANVDGIIKNNQVNNNKEGGIEVIAGKSELIIADNSLKNNTASGIAVQFYKSTKNLGKLKILGNILSGNGNYGVDCKIPSGGNPGASYWSQSIQFKYNKVKNNGKGDFAKFCKFTKEDIMEATKTEKEIAELKKRAELDKEKKVKMLAEQKQQEELKKAEKKRKEDEEKKRIEQRERDWEIKRKVEKKLNNDFASRNSKQKEYIIQLQKEKKWKIFFVGVSEDILENFSISLGEDKKILDETARMLSEIKTVDLKNDLEIKFAKKRQNYENNFKIYEEYKNKFGLWPWVKNIF